MTNPRPFPNLSYDHGVSPQKLIGETIGVFFDRQVEAYRARLALVVRHQNVRWTWGEFAARVDALAAGLRARGCWRGGWSRVAPSACGRPTMPNGQRPSSPPPRRASCWSTSTRPISAP